MRIVCLKVQIKTQTDCSRSFWMYAGFKRIPSFTTALTLVFVLMWNMNLPVAMPCHRQFPLQSDAVNAPRPFEHIEYVRTVLHLQACAFRNF